MKNKLLMGIGVLALALTSCSEDWGPSDSKGGGYITPMVELDASTLKSRADETQEEEEYKVPNVKIEDLKFKLSKNDGSFTQEFTYDKFPVDKAFSVGEYTLSAYYGDPTEEGFDIPALYGEQTLTVRDKQKTTVNLSVTLANALVKMNYSEDFKNYMTSWSAKVNEVSVASTEKKPVFVNPGKVNLKLKATKPNGKEVDLSLPSLTTVARYLHNVNVTINSETGGAGKAQLVITYNEEMETVTDTLDISDEVLSAPAPVIDPDGYEEGVPVKVLEGLPYSSSLAMSIIAIAGLEEVTLETNSANLLSRGWPSSIELMAATEPQQNKLRELGLNVLGLWKNPGEMAYIDFSAVVKNLKYEILYASNQTTFTVTVKDKLMRESNPSTIILNVEPIVLQLSSAGDNFNPGEPMNVNLAFNGTKEDLENLIFEFKDKSGNWRTTDLKITEISVGEEKDGLTNFTITLNTPDYNDDLLLRAKLLDKYSNQFTFPMAPFEVSLIENDVFAKYAYVKVVPTNGNPTPNTDNAEFYVKTEESNFVKINSEKDLDGYFKISELTPNTNYQIRVKIGKDSSKATSFITEKATQVPNGDFEKVELKYTERGMYSGGPFSVLRVGDYHNTANFDYYEATDWTTTNEKTMSGINRNTWFIQPSACSTESYYEGIGSSNVGNEVSSQYSYEGRNNSKAIIIRNIGWSANGVEPDKMNSASSLSNQHNSNEPKEYSKEVGKLFLGNYSYNVDSNDEVISEGIPFNSRPNSLKGFYKYSLDKSNQPDSSIIIIQICKDDIIIQKIEKILEPKSEFTSFTIPLNYSKESLKANKLCLMIKSSALTNDNVNVSSYVSRFESYFHGATLVIDDLEFEY